MRRFLRLLFILLTCILAATLFVACNGENNDETQNNDGANNTNSTIDYSDFVFYEFKNNTVEVSRYIGDSETVTVPSSYLGKPVVSIGAGAFFNSNNVKQITIPDSVISVSTSAFENCISIEQAEIPTVAVSAIPKDNLKQVMITSGKALVESAFKDCETLKEATICDEITNIGDSAFYNCTSLETVAIGDGVTTVGSSAFYNCKKLAKVTIGKAVRKIGGNAFKGCYALEGVYIMDIQGWCEIEYSGYESMPLYYYADNLYLNGQIISGDVEIPEGTSKITNYAFYHCSNITSIVIPNSIKDIGDGAFWGCTGLKCITLGNGITQIKDWVFSGCKSIEEIYISDLRAWCELSYGNNALISSSKLYLNNQLVQGDIQIPNGTSRIARGAFYGYSYITSVTLPDSVTSIETEVFRYCANLKSVTLNEGLEYIGTLAFADCTSLSSIAIPNSVTRISDWAFNNCSELNEVVIGNGIVDMGMSVFSSTPKLERVYYMGNSAQWEGISFSSTYDELKSLPRYYYSEQNPYENGTAIDTEKYWHYNGDCDIVVWEE